MRVISQDGSCDFPYERVSFRIHCKQNENDGNYILCAPLGGNGEIIARYSTPEKLIEVMDMLHTNYANYILFTNQQPQSGCNIYFRFPADE